MSMLFSLLERIREVEARGEPAALATVVRVIGSSPGHLAAKMLVTASGEAHGSVGGGCVDGAVFAAAREVIRDERPRTITVDLTESPDPDHGLICGGRVEVFIEPLIAPRLFILGAGHVGQAVARAATPLGFRAVVVDDRERFASRQRFPEAVAIHVGEFRDVLPSLEAGPTASVLVVTRGHRYDELCLEWGARTEARYVGLIGSHVKIRKICARLRARGVPEEALARVRAPIGIDVGAVTVEEIAAAVAAELVAVRRLGAQVGRALAPLDPDRPALPPHRARRAPQEGAPEPPPAPILSPPAGDLLA